MRLIAIGGRRIGHDHPPGVADFVDNQIVDNTAARIKHKTITAGALGDAFKVNRKEIREIAFREVCFNSEFTHVANIKEAGVLPRPMMFLEYAAILDRHEPAAKRR